MSKPGPHNAILAKVAKQHLAPLGCTRVGRSRLWISDHGFWTIVVEFQPSGFGRGSYLNVGAHWLWYPSDGWSFDFGDPIREPGFIEFVDEKQFTLDAHELAAKAVFRVRELRGGLHSLRAIARLLNETVHPHWGRYHAAIASGLVGDVTTALEHVNALSGVDTNLHALVRSLTERLAEPQAFRRAVARIIQESRRLHKLAEAPDVLALLDAGEN